jgi:tripeptidyl-peptidase-1
MRFSIVTVAAVLAALAEASPFAGTHVVHEKRDAPLKKWVKRDALNPRAVLPMRIGLVQSNLDKGHDMLMGMSDMESSQYGKHMTAEEIIEFFAPPQDAVDAVRGWLEEAGIAAGRIGHSANKQWIQFDATVSEAEELLKTKYHSYEHMLSGNSNIGCDE